MTHVSRIAILNLVLMPAHYASALKLEVVAACPLSGQLRGGRCIVDLSGYHNRRGVLALLLNLLAGWETLQDVRTHAGR